jgi:hypothetical protein
LRAFENRLLRRIFGHKREKMAGGCRRLHNEELYNSYTSPSIIGVIKSRSVRWSGHVARKRPMRNAGNTLVEKPEGKRTLGRPRRRWKDTIRMDLREVGWEGVDWIHLIQDRDQWRANVNTVMNL